MPNPYDELPPSHTWYDPRYGTQFYKYKGNEPFYFIFLFFDHSRSKNYPKALKIYNSIPEKYRFELLAHSVQVYYYSDFLKIRKKFVRLVKLSSGWKLTQIWINNELCTATDFYTFVEMFDARVIRYNRKHPNAPLPPIEEE